MLNKIFIVDFEDSFTYNIASVIYEHFPHHKSIEVISHSQFFSASFFESIFKSANKMGVILGPGPGHPKMYGHYFPLIENLIKRENTYLMGICLGHQILGFIHGYEIDYCTRPIHGESEEIFFQNKVYWVQKYNSLCVKKDGGVSDILQGENWISYQFHPESIGTTDNIDFFKPLLNF